MAIKFNKLEAVEFGDVKMLPQVTAEMELRLQQTFRKGGSSLEDINDNIELLSECFGDAKEEAKKYISAMSMFDRQILQAYLLGGQRLVDTITEQVRHGRLQNG